MTLNNLLPLLDIASESPSRDSPPLPKRKARWNHTSKEKSTSLSVPELNVEKQEKNDEGNSRHSVNKREPVGRNSIQFQFKTTLFVNISVQKTG